MLQVECFATTASDHSELRARAEAACHSFHQLAGQSDLAVAQAVNRAGAHLLINLFGFLDKSRNSIAACAPALRHTLPAECRPRARAKLPFWWLGAIADM